MNVFNEKQPQCEPEAIETTADTSAVEETLFKVEQDLGPQPLSVMKARWKKLLVTILYDWRIIFPTKAEHYNK